MPKVPKIRSLHIFVISPESIGDEVDFLPADKDKSFPEVYDIFAVSQGKHEGWSWFFASR